MIDPAELIEGLVATLRDIPELVAELYGDDRRIYAYHDDFPQKSSILAAIHEMPAPAIMAAWQGTQPGSFGGMDVWKHSVTLYLRAGESLPGDPPTFYYRLFRLITKGVPAHFGGADAERNGPSLLLPNGSATHSAADRCRGSRLLRGAPHFHGNR